MKLDVIYDDQDLLVINKPAGISVHKTHPQDPHTTLADILVGNHPYLQGVGENPLRPGIVHRLDKETSGLMVIAKNQNAFTYMKNQFQERKVKKYYLALVWGHPKQPSGTIDIPLGKIGTKQTTQLHGKKTLTERDALTRYETVRKFKDFTLLGAMPETGRTHQIRVHLKSLGTPVVGDKIYDSKRTGLPDGLNRLFLHAHRLEFTAPDGKRLAFEADLPEDLQKVLSALQ